MSKTSLFPTQEQYTVEIEETEDYLSLTVESDGSLRLVNIKTQIAKFQGIFKDIAPGVSLADQLIQDRRKEAYQESQS